jgi:hypothetical protein
MAGATTSFAAELPNYEVSALPISQVQVGVLGAAHVQEQAPVATASLTPHQLSVLTPRPRTTASVAGRTEGRAH